MLLPRMLPRVLLPRMLPCVLLPRMLPAARAGNYCVGGSQGREEGNGRVVISRHNGRAGAECGYEVLKTINVPPTAAFTDYSGMAFRGNKVRARVCRRRCSCMDGRAGARVCFAACAINSLATRMFSTCCCDCRSAHAGGHRVAGDLCHGARGTHGGGVPGGRHWVVR
jgi:hypothetical protein